MRTVDEEKPLAALESLLFESLLVNFAGEVREYVEQQASREVGKAGDTVHRALRRTSDYLDTLAAVGWLPALHPPQSQREAYHRHISAQVARSFKAAEAESIMLSLCSRTVLLYGRRSIVYVSGLDEQRRRMEIPLHAFSTSIEHPRMNNIDPFGLDYMLRVFRTERLKA